MIFKRKFLFLLSATLLFVSCGLDLGEESPSASSYRASLDSAFCRDLDYKKAFYSYFTRTEEDALKKEGSSSGKLWKQAIICVAKKIDELKSISKEESLNREELQLALKHDIVTRSGIAPAAQHINQAENFEHYLLLKTLLTQLIKEKKAGRFIGREFIERVEEPVLTQVEMDFFADFLEEMSDFFIEVEQSSQEILEGFKENGLVSKSSIEESDELQIKFLSFLQEWLSEDFPEYANFLSANLIEPEEVHEEEEKAAREGLLSPYLALNPAALTLDDLFSPDSKKQEKLLHSQLRSEISRPFLSMMKLPSSPVNFSVDEITAQNIKYLLLNIYALQALFAIFDRDKNGKLSPDEQDFIYRTTHTIVSIVVPPHLKDQQRWVRWFSNPEDISYFIIQEQQLLHPTGGFKPWTFRLKRSVSSKKPEKTLSYTDVSCFVTLLFHLTYKSIMKEELPQTCQI